MAKCMRCGKTGLFLKLNAMGYCKSCESWTNTVRSNFYESPILKKHYDYLQKIESTYKLANAQDNPFNPQMDKCLNLCIQDMAIAKQFRDLCVTYKQPIPSYGSFKRAAIIYDKRKMYNEAIEVCTKSILLGYTDQNDMYSRLARLLKKSNGITVEQHLAQYGININDYNNKNF